MFNNFFAGKRVLLTGHAGFKGSWLTLLLHNLGAEISGYSLLTENKPRLYEILNLSELLQHEKIADIRNREVLKSFIYKVQPEIVIHLAAQPLVLESYIDPIGTYETNVVGTLNLLHACMNCSAVKAVVNVTTDKCYENLEDGRSYKETDRLGGYDMYSSSKACSEILSASFRRSFLNQSGKFLLATARAGNVIGGGDFAANRLIPDCMRSLASGKPIELRHPNANRPWQFVLEPLVGYLALAKQLYEGNIEAANCFNFGPEPEQIKSVSEMAELMASEWGGGQIQCQPYLQGGHEAEFLTLDNSKAKKQLHIAPVLDVSTAVSYSVQWYKTLFYRNFDMRVFTIKQISAFIKTAQALRLDWSK